MKFGGGPLSTTLLAACTAASACNPSAVFIDPTGKTCAGTVGACPDGWSCVPALQGPGTICWPTADAGEEDAGEDGGIPDSGFTGGGDAGPDAGRDAGRDGGVPDGSVPDSGPVGDGGPSCEIGGKTIPAGTVNPANACQECEPAQSPTAWTTFATGTACGTALFCLGGSCVPACSIGGQVEADGAPNPASACQTCQPSVSAVAWSNLADGKSCAPDGGSSLCLSGVCSSVCAIDGGFVPAAQLNPADPCQQCSPSLSNSSWTVLADGTTCDAGRICATGSCSADCDIGGTVVVGNTVRSTNPCQVCLPASSNSNWSNMADTLACGTDELCASGQCVFGCNIGGSAVDAGSSPAGNPCQTCQPTQSSTGWTLLVDGTACPGGICVSGSCANDCNIGGSFVAANTLEASNPCQECLPATSATGWSNAPNGSSCGTGLVCSSGHCVGGCGVGGIAVDAGTSQPGNPCATCDPALSTTSFSPVPNGTACGTGLSCAGGLCCGGTHGTLSCSGAPIDTCLDDLNCGFCGNACSAPNGCFAGQCQLAAPLPTARDGLAAATSPDGRIYAIGGEDINSGNAFAKVEIFDPRTNVWSTGPNLTRATEFLGAIGTASGIFAMGGSDSNYDAFSDGLYLGVDAGAWVATPAASAAFMDNVPALGPGGVFFLPGGCDIVSGVCNIAGTSQVLKFTSSGAGAGGSWAVGPSLPFEADELGDTGGLDGTIYAISGSPDDATPIPNLQILSPGAAAWVQGPSVPTPRCDMVAITDKAGLIYAIGGDNCPATNGSYTIAGNTEIYSPDAGTWTEGPPLPTAVTNPGCTLGQEGRIYVIGGLDGFSDQNTVQVFNPVTQNWIP